MQKRFLVDVIALLSMKNIVVYTYMFLFMFFTSMIVTTVCSIDRDKEYVDYFIDLDDNNDNKKQKFSGNVDDFVQHAMLNLTHLKMKMGNIFFPFIFIYDYYHLNTILQPPELVHFVY